MAIESIDNLSGLNLGELYRVYLAIARADHQWRTQTLYGEAAPPPGHCEFRPLSIEQFEGRLEAARSLAHGEAMLRQRLARQAASYGVDVSGELFRLRNAA